MSDFVRIFFASLFGLFLWLNEKQTGPVGKLRLASRVIDSCFTYLSPSRRQLLGEILCVRVHAHVFSRC